MAKIHGLVYLLVGGFISYVSWIISFDNLKLFFYLGFVFAGIGIVKIFFAMSRKDEKEKQHEGKKPMSAQQHRNISNNQRSQFKRCQRCYNVMRLQDNFCSLCGFKV